MNKPIPVFETIQEWSQTEIRVLDREDYTYVIKNVQEFEAEFFKQFPRLDNPINWDEMTDHEPYKRHLLNDFFELFPEKYRTYVRKITF